MEAPRISHASLIAFSAIFLATFSTSATAFSILEGFDAPFRARPCLATSHLSSCRLRTNVSARTYSTRFAKGKIFMTHARGSHSHPSFDENEAMALGLGAGTRPVVPGDAPLETTTTLVVPHHQNSRRKMMTMLLAVGVSEYHSDKFQAGRTSTSIASHTLFCRGSFHRDRSRRCRKGFQEPEVGCFPRKITS